MKKSLFLIGFTTLFFAACNMAAESEDIYLSEKKIVGRTADSVVETTPSDSENPEANPDIIPETEISQQKPLPVFKGQDYQFDVKIKELSGICLPGPGEVNNKFLWGVDDNGGLFKIFFDGTLSLEWDIEAGMEGIAIDSKTGDLYIGLEDYEQSAFKVPYTDKGYNFEDEAGYEMLFTIPDAKKLDNYGIEGITCYKDGLYIGIQKNATLRHYTFDGTSWTLKDEKSLNDAIADKNKHLKEIAGLDYDEENDRLWVLDSEKFRIYLFNGEGTELIDSWKIKETSKKNPEGLCIDKERHCIWVCEDTGKSKCIVHKYLFDNL